MSHQSRPLLNELAERMAASNSCYASLQGHLVEYHNACAAMDWRRADKVRVIIVETLEAALDATASVFKKLDPNGQTTHL